jgi:hypothetical protein
MMGIGARAVACDFTKDASVPAMSAFKSLQSENRSAFAEGQTVPLDIKWPALCRGESLERIEAREDHLAQAVIPASQYTLSASTAEKVPGMANGVRARSAGVGDNGDAPLKPKRLRQVQALPLRLVIDDAARLMGLPHRQIGALPEITLSQAHASAGRPEDHRQSLTAVPPTLDPSLFCGQQQKLRRAVEPLDLSSAQLRHSEPRGQIRLGCHLDSLTADVEKRHWAKRGAADPKTSYVVGPIQAQGSNQTCPRDDDPRLGRWSLRGEEQHGEVVQLMVILNRNVGILGDEVKRSLGRRRRYVTRPSLGSGFSVEEEDFAYS